MPGISVWNGSAWTPIKALPVWNGSAWPSAKKVKTWDGSAWRLTWVPPVPVVTLTFSKTGVQAGESFSATATLSIPAPEGTTVTFAFPGWSSTVPIDEGTTSVAIGGLSHQTAGSYSWTATAVNLGGTTPSAAVVQTVTAAAPAHFHEVVPAGSNGSAIQAAMDRAYNWWIANKSGRVNYDDENSFACVELPASSTYQLSTALHFRRGVRLVGAGSGASRPVVNGQGASHVMNTDNNGGGGYKSPHYDWLVHNIIFDCSQYSGGFSVAHTQSFRVTNCFFKNMGGKKHYIEVNSSGGPRTDGTYSVQILNCEFTNSNKSTENGQARRTEDECIQMDYSWTGAASAVANDGTCANNVLIDGCYFHECPRGVGSHHYEEGVGGEHYPLGIHSNIKVSNCTFRNVNPTTYGDGANGRGSEGALRGYTWNYVLVTGNLFDACLQPINFYIQDGATTRNGNPTYYRVWGNTIRNQSADRPGINCTSAHASMRHEQCLIENNTVDGTWSSTDYFVGMEDTGTSKLPASDYGVVIRNNLFSPSNKDAAAEKAYNKYRADGADNGGSAVMVLIYGNTVSDGTEDNS